MNTELRLKVSEVQRFCMHDGPGIRTTVFLKGCPLRCVWCHNPETQKAASELLYYKNKCIDCLGCVQVCKTDAHREKDGRHVFLREDCGLCFECANLCPTGALEICGKDMSVSEIIAEVKKDAAFHGKNGGITISGGEPFAQKEGLLSLLQACRKDGIPTAVESCGYADAEALRAAVPYTDLFLWDLKDTDPKRHKEYTGLSNERILENLSLINGLGAKIRLRCILVNGVNTDEVHYGKLAELALLIKNSDGLEIIPYHAFAGTKSEFIGRADSGRPEWIPTDGQIALAKKLIRSKGVFVY